MNILHRIPRPVSMAVSPVVGLAVIWVANHAGLWWMTALVGVVLGFALRPGRAALLLSWLAALAAWGLDLLVQSFHSDIGGVAGVVALIAGLPRSAGFVIIVVALLFASLLALAGAWVGIALRRVLQTYGLPLALTAPPEAAHVATKPADGTASTGA
jgi:hypothetical protein